MWIYTGWPIDKGGHPPTCMWHGARSTFTGCSRYYDVSSYFWKGECSEHQLVRVGQVGKSDRSTMEWAVVGRAPGNETANAIMHIWHKSAPHYGGWSTYVDDPPWKEVEITWRADS